MNDTISDIFNLSITIESMMEAHSCHEEKCTGPKYGGLNITCGMCLFPCYYDCLSTRDEFKHLMKHMKIETIEDNDQKKLNEAHVKIKSLFGINSIFEFICPSCKGTLNNTTIYDMKKKLEQNYDELQSEYDELKKENRTMKTQNTKITNELTKIKAKLYDEGVQMKSQQLGTNTNEYESELAIMRSQIDQKNREMESFSDELKTILATQQSCLEKFKLESENAIKGSVDLLNKLSSCISNSEVRVEEIDDDVVIKVPSQVNQVQNLDPGFHGENLRQKNVKKPHPFNKPSTSRWNSDQSNVKKSEYHTELYEIHISPFELSVDSEQIIQHILTNTKIGARSFSVQRLGGYGLGRSFISFKVSTLDREANNAILSEELWTPNQIARPFKNSTPKRNRSYDNDNNGNDDRFIKSNFRNPYMQQNNGFDSGANKQYIPRFDQRRQQNYNDHQQQTHPQQQQQRYQSYGQNKHDFDHRQQQNDIDHPQHMQNRQQQEQSQYRNNEQQTNRNFLVTERGHDRQRRNSYNPFRSKQQ